MFNTPLNQVDPDIQAAIEKENERQEAHLELIASENYTSRAVIEAQGTQLTNKYAEGYPHKRYYGGCEHVDIVEELAIERAKALFNAGYANVQPHSGSSANAAVFLALVKPGDTILGMSLAHGGHLTHGAKPSFSGKHFDAHYYGVDKETGLIDYDEVRRIALECKPKMIIAGFSAYSRVMDWAKFREIADEVGAYLLVDMAHVAGLVATGAYPSPIPFADVVTTTTHKTLRGPRGGMILSKGGNPDLEKKLNSAVFPGSQGGPLMHVIAGKAVCFKEAMEPGFKTYQEQVIKNAQAMAAVLQERGLDVVSGGTDNHLLLVDLTKWDITGKDAAARLGDAHITVNMNTVPNETRSPMITSGIRIGTPALTTRGINEQEAADVASWICDLLESPESAEVLEAVKEKVAALCASRPVYTK
ncbi:MAG: serine hydroxymethyltransferase [Pseudomonadota bacterium]|nr:serine hydroxymethyltransferase [Gammaproteobacteria bacterium]MEC8010236.1 serine hydroxymethyltransferase [Pseudomonadota bacterium]HBF07411.1 serine hydroxymethyltransferase [Gammaproteobacteria bacterium]|tara:strand:+ start:64271 stop:65524 length:1254 start_codon:yes stop_codon:yes gene_type:complete